MKVLFISEVQWLSQPSRKHQLVRRFPSDWDVLFLSPVNLTRDENSFRMRETRTPARVRHVSIFLPKPNSRLPFARAMTRPLLSIGGRRVMSYLRSFRPDVVVCSYIWAAPLVPAIRALGIPVVYDCNDYHPRFFPNWRGPAERAFASLIDGADEVVASSTYLGRICGRGVVIGNGADLVMFDPRCGTERPAAIARSPLARCKDLVVYVGSVDDRLDFACLEALAEALAGRKSRSGLVVVGRIYESVRRDAERLAARHPGVVHFTGRVPYTRLPAYLAGARAGIAPFVLSEKTEAINANKLYMYAAMNLNVVCTPFSDEVRHYEGLVYLAASPRAFAEAVLEAVVDEERRGRLRSEIALPNGWDDRASEFVELLLDATRGGTH